MSFKKFNDLYWCFPAILIALFVIFVFFAQIIGLEVNYSRLGAGTVIGVLVLIGINIWLDYKQRNQRTLRQMFKICASYVLHSREFHKATKKVLGCFLLICFAGFILLAAFWAFLVMIFPPMPTQVKFQSSDGAWRSEGEDFFKLTRDFEDVIYSFELYKIRCHKPEAFLQRITERPSKGSAEDRANNYKELKWGLPYAEPPSVEIDCFKPENREHCVCSFNESATEQEKELAHHRAELYLSEAKKEGWLIKRMKCKAGEGCEVVIE